jgi:hypothetical protein
MEYTTTAEYESRHLPGVKFSVRRMSFGQRLEMLKQFRSLVGRLEYERAGSEAGDKLSAAITEMEMQRLCVESGLDEVTGLTIDGREPGSQEVLARGPEALCREIVAAVRQENFLSSDERKN